ncbi:MAG TPA: YncE family protein, partial [Thermoplasmata archaeon]|nr:YncE family protein [Thermoplasmata archaeon]
LPNPAVAGAVNGNGSAVWVVGQGGLEELNLTYGTATSGPGVGVDPTAIKFDKASGEFLVLNSGSDNLTLLNATTNAVSGQIPLAGTPEGQAVKVGPGLYAILLDDPASVEIVNATMRTVVRILPLHLGFSQFAHGSLVAEGADTIVRPGEPLVGTSDLPLRSGVPEPVDPVGIADGFVLQASQNAVFYLDPGRTYCGRHNTPCPKVIAVGQDPRGILYDPAVGRIFVTNTGSDNVSVLNATPFAQVIATLAVGPAPGPMALDPSNGRLYVADQGGDNLTVLDPAALTVVGSVAVGTHPSALSFDKFGKFLYVANAGSGNVSVVNALTGATSGSIGGVPGVDAVLAGASVGAVYVASATSGVVTLYASAIARWSAFVGFGPQLFGQFINDPMRILVALDETDSVAVLFTGP